MNVERQHSQGLRASTTNKGQSSMALPKELIERLFAKFGAFYGRHFADMWAGQNPETVKEVWAEELSNFSREELGRGFEAAKRNKFPPTLPEFMALCRPPLDYEAAYHEAVTQMRLRHDGDRHKRYGADTWSNPAIYWAAAAIGGDIQTHQYTAMKSRWKAALDEALANPNPVPDYSPAIPAPGKVITPPDEARKKIMGLVEILAAKTSVNRERPVREDGSRKSTEELEREFMEGARSITGEPT